MAKNRKSSDTQIRINTKEVSRLDRFLADRYPDYSRTYFKRLIEMQAIQVDGHPITSHHKLRPGQTLTINWPKPPKKSSSLNTKDLPFSVLYEDEVMMVINKPANLLVHPTSQFRKGGTLVEILEGKIESGDWPDKVRPGLVHRLDRDTTGILLFAKTPPAHMKLSKQFSSRRIKKTYKAIVMGTPDAKEGTLEGHLARDTRNRKKFAVRADGRLAITKFHVDKTYGKKAALMTLHPLTGRTHQIRVQLASYGYPIIGDLLYGHTKKEFPFVERHLLHASAIEVLHPKKLKVMRFEAPLPEDFLTAIKLIRSSHE